MNKEDEFKPFVERPEVAFPSTFRSIGEPEQQIHRAGMELRDYFAAKAMQAILRGYDVVNSFEDEEVSDPEGMPHLIAKDAYIMADAMMKARDSSE